MFLCDCYCQKTKNKNKFEISIEKYLGYIKVLMRTPLVHLKIYSFEFQVKFRLFLIHQRYQWEWLGIFDWETNFSILIIVIVKGSSKLEFWISFYFEIENCQISWEWIDFFEWTPPAWGWASRTPPPTPPWWTRPSRSTSRPWPCSRCWSTVVQVIIQKAHPRIIIARAPLL